MIDRCSPPVFVLLVLFFISLSLPAQDSLVHWYLFPFTDC